MISGRALGASVAGTIEGDTGALASTGGDLFGFAGQIHLTGPGYSLGPNVTAMGRVGMIAGTRTVSSIGTVLNLHLTVGGVVISADTVQAQASAGCGQAPTGSTLITNLQVNGVSLAAAFDAAFDGSVVNATLPLPGGVGTLTTNEQTVNPGMITVNAIHIHATSGQDIILGHAEADRQ